mmetsp:Transcript_26155/g.65737  ORF Transcript_26155/g.65737 Transcript_26155/m.65737 type:complete len:305 (-) Transcript_26155:674-1588(-)
MLPQAAFEPCRALPWRHCIREDPQHIRERGGAAVHLLVLLAQHHKAPLGPGRVLLQLGHSFDNVVELLLVRLVLELVRHLELVDELPAEDLARRLEHRDDGLLGDLQLGSLARLCRRRGLAALRRRRGLGSRPAGGALHLHGGRGRGPLASWGRLRLHLLCQGHVLVVGVHGAGTHRRRRRPARPRLPLHCLPGSHVARHRVQVLHVAVIVVLLHLHLRLHVRRVLILRVLRVIRIVVPLRPVLLQDLLHVGPRLPEILLLFLLRLDRLWLLLLRLLLLLVLRHHRVIVVVKDLIEIEVLPLIG